MWRLIILVALSCQPKQPLQPSFFTAKPEKDPPLDCSQTLDCYAACQPLTEECMLLCDRRAAPAAVSRAREVSYCVAQSACTDAACEQERCAPQLAACRPSQIPPT